MWLSLEALLLDVASIEAPSIIIPFPLSFFHKKLRLLFNEKERFPVTGYAALSIVMFSYRP